MNANANLDECRLCDFSAKIIYVGDVVIEANGRASGAIVKARLSSSFFE